MMPSRRERAVPGPEPISSPPALDPSPGQARVVAIPETGSPVPGPLSDQAIGLAEPTGAPPWSGSNGQGRPVVTPHPNGHAAVPAYRELRVFAELFADVQQTRTACANRVERAGLDPFVLGVYLEGLRETEHDLGLAMVRCYRRVVDPRIRQWQVDTPGIGEHLLARLLGVIGHPRHAKPYHWESLGGADADADTEGASPRRVLVADPPFERNVAKLWAYCGHGDPTRKRRRGMAAEAGAALGNPRAKVLVHLLAESTIKCVGSDAKQLPEPMTTSRPARRRSPYRDTYEQAREHYADREGWTLAHQHAAALRLVGKEILRDLWLAAES